MIDKKTVNIYNYFIGKTLNNREDINAMKIYINENQKKGTIAPEIYGHFSEHLGRCIYDGLYVGEESEIPNENGMRSDVVKALKDINIPVLRWPGGCFADEYHWKDGIGPKEKRKKMVNTHWGGTTEDNSFGTHEYFELCRQLGCKTYVCGNVGSGTVQEMSEWVEYMTFDGVSPMAELRRENGREQAWKLDYFGVGNENWGCGGNMTPDYYAHLYRRYQTYVRNYQKEQPIFKICGGADSTDYAWTDTVLHECFRQPMPADAHGFMDGLSIHYYVGTEKGEHKGSAADFGEEEWNASLKRALGMDELIKRHGAIMDQYDPEKKIGMIIDEWGCWHDVEVGTNPGFLYQQNTMRDAMVAGVTLNIFNKHCDRVKMACIAQVVNVLQSVVLTEGKRMLLTPTYHVFHMYRHHQGAELLESCQETDAESNSAVQESASVDHNGVITITLANSSLRESQNIEILLTEKKPVSAVGSIVCGSMNAHNTFDQPETVSENEFTDFKLEERGLSLVIPPCSIVMFRIQ